jgi:glycosyltransferase involved in cell wall biosynthesis
MPPNVSVIIPCYNEKATVAALLDALHEQTYPLAEMEVVIADGMSTDGTREVIDEWATNHSDLSVSVVDNPKQIIPAALNAAIKASNGEIILRLDAHAKPDPDYVKHSVNDLQSGKAQNVGGIWEIQPGANTWIAHSIAVAAGHPIGVGDARYRYTDKANYVDTVPFGCFYRSLLDQIGMFDETLLTNEDYEFNTRIRQIGGKIWLNPKIHSEYYARRSLKALAKQYWRYGYWKLQMLRRYPATIRWRQALPPVFVATITMLFFLAIFWGLARWAFVGIISLYGLILLLAGLQLAIRHKNIAYALGVPLAIACMHFSWGAGFLWGLLFPPKSK